ncbi:MAG: indole-3-glycerol-phosphate synthase [Steroidobacteraceae bacterium]
MSGFLDAMARSSRSRVAAAVAREPIAALRVRSLGTPPAPTLSRGGPFDLIAEYKRRSPSAGELAGNADLVDRVTAYAEAGAIAVSVLTEPSAFDGSLTQAEEAAHALAPLGVPVLRKDFLVDPYQLYETRAVGAGGALLIVRLLSDARLAEMLDCARELGLFVLLEAFDAADIERAAAAAGGLSPARAAEVLLGVNCRDLQTLEVEPQRLRELAPRLPDEWPRVAESGIASPDDCADAARAGYDMALVGSVLMSARDPAAVIRIMLAASHRAARAAA